MRQNRIYVVARLATEIEDREATEVYQSLSKAVKRMLQLQELYPDHKMYLMRCEDYLSYIKKYPLGYKFRREDEIK
jgi:hypothetical protein